jgi:hypothetical protein
MLFVCSISIVSAVFEWICAVFDGTIATDAQRRVDCTMVSVDTLG